MSLRRRLEAERLRGIQRAAREEERAHRRRMLLAFCSILFWLVLGAALMAWGLHTTDVRYGRTALEAGALLATAGTLGTLLWMSARRE